MEPIYTTSELKQQIVAAERKAERYRKKFYDIQEQYLRYRRKYHNAVKIKNRAIKDRANIPMPYKRSSAKMRRDIMAMNISMAALALNETIRKYKIAHNLFNLMAVCYNHDFMSMRVLRHSYPTIFKSMRRIERKVGVLEEKGFMRIVPNPLDAKSPNFIITEKGRIFVDAVNASILRKLTKDGKGLRDAKAKKKDTHRLQP